MGLKDEIIGFTKDFINSGKGDSLNYLIDFVWNKETKSESIEIIDNQTIKVTCLISNPENDFIEVDGKIQKSTSGKFEMIVKVFGKVTMKVLKSSDFKSMNYFFSKYSESLNTFLNEKKFSDKQLKKKCLSILSEFKGVNV